MAHAPVPFPSARRHAVPTVALGVLTLAALARAAEAPRRLTLADALARAEQGGFDALAAEATVRAAEADREKARRFPNPAFTGAWLHSTSVPVPGGTTSSDGYSVAASDQGAVEGLASGKRSLRIGGAESALESARFGREDTLRAVRRDTAHGYYDVLLAEAVARVEADVAGSYERTLELVDERLRFGAASRVEHARVEVAALEAAQALTEAGADVARARSVLRVLLGGDSLDGVVLDGTLEGRPPDWIERSDLASLREAVAARPDVRAARADLDRTQAALDLARRERLPDVALSAGYARQGPDVAPVTPPTLSLGAAFELPVFSQRQGEIARADSERAAAAITLARTEARATADVDAAWAALAAARERVTRMETVLLDRARETRDLVRYQYREGAVSLLDLFDAERTALQVELENAQSLYALRIAVVDLEAAVGRTAQP